MICTLALLLNSGTIANATPTSSENTLKLSQFLELFLSEREELKQALAEFRQAEATLRARSDFWATEVGIRPLLNHRLQENTSPEIQDFKFSERLNTLSGEINQELPYGLTARVEGLKNILPPNENVPSLDYQYSGALSIPLWRNAFGRLQKAEQSQAAAEARRAKLAFETRLIEECLNGFETYLDSFNQTERFRIAQEKLKVAQEALRISEISWKKKLIREIDILSARSNFLSSQIEWKLAEKEASVALSNLFITTRSLLDAHYQKKDLKVEPPVLARQAPSNLPDLDSHPQLLSAQAALENARYAWQSEQERRRPDVNLNVVAGSTQGRTAGIRFFNFNEEFLRIFVDFRIPVNRRDQAEVESAYQRSLSFEAEIPRLKKLLELQWQDSKEQYDADLDRLQWSEKSIGFHRQRLRRAQELLQSGRMPFDEFIRYNDSLFQEEERKISLHQDLLRNHLSLLLMAQQLPEFCQRPNL